MNIEQWWPRLAPGIRRWLVAHNGEVIPSLVMTAIRDAGDPLNPTDWWWDSNAGDFTLSDAVVDWIEAIANDEGQAPRSGVTVGDPSAVRVG